MLANLIIRLKRFGAELAIALLVLFILALATPLWSCSKICKAEYKTTQTQEDEDDNISAREQIAQGLIEEI